MRLGRIGSEGDERIEIEIGTGCCQPEERDPTAEAGGVIEFIQAS